MKNNIFILKIIFVTINILIFSCNAPHSNPFDPNNKDNNYSNLSGTIKTVRVPNSPITDVTLLWLNDKKIAYTDENGYFSFENIDKENGYIHFEKLGYSCDSIYVGWEDGNSKTISGFLNSDPKINNFVVSSVVLNDYPSQQIYNLEISANISDDENDVDSVFVINSYLPVKQILSYNLDKKLYEKEFLNFVKIEKVIGKEFGIIVKDRNKKEFNIGGTILKRIIKQELSLISPKNNQAVLNNPELKWERFTPGFDFEYLLQIYTKEIVPKLAFEKENISSNLISYKVSDTLSGSINEYFWVVWAIDEFGNRTRSKPATFTITN